MNEECFFKISLFEHFISLFLPCLIKNNKNNLFDSLNDYAIEYTDLLNLVNTKAELEKLKFVLLTEQQLAIFNLITLPEIPNKTVLRKDISKLYKYSRDLKNQDNELWKFNEKVNSGQLQLSKLEIKLIDLLD